MVGLEHFQSYESIKQGRVKLYRVFFLNWRSPISVPKRKPAKQPITAFLSIRIYRNSTSDWLAGSFLFGTEIGEHQLKKTPCISIIQIHTYRLFRDCNIQLELYQGACCTTLLEREEKGGFRRKVETRTSTNDP